MPSATNPLVHRGKAAETFVLQNGDEFRVGNLKFRFVLAWGESKTATPRHTVRHP
jgi:hypothetical protein